MILPEHVLFSVQSDGVKINNRILVMRVQPSVKKICRHCKIIRRNRVVRVICTDPRHKQKQG